MFSATIAFVYYNVKYMDDLAAARIQDFETKSGMKVSEFKTKNPIPEEIRPEYVIPNIDIRSKNKKENIDQSWISKNKKIKDELSI